MPTTENRKFVEKKEVLFFVFMVIILYLVIFFFPMEKTGDIIATVYYQSEKYTEINLTQASDGTVIQVSGDLPVQLEVKDHGIAFIHAQCPDKICEQYGYIKKAGQQAICLPAKVSVIIHTKGQEIDIIAD